MKYKYNSKGKQIETHENYSVTAVNKLFKY